MDITFIIAFSAAPFVIAGAILLQIFLSKRTAKLPGLILPGLSFLLFFVYPLFRVDWADIWQNGRPLILLLLLGNALTILLMILYTSFRKKQDKKAQLEKMSIQDLK